MKLDRNQLALEPKFQNFEDITVMNLEFWSIIDQMGRFTYNHGAKFISDYLKPYVKKEYSIDNTQTFPNRLSSIAPLQEDEEVIWYYVKSLFTNILIKETID